MRGLRQINRQAPPSFREWSRRQAAGARDQGGRRAKRARLRLRSKVCGRGDCPVGLTGSEAFVHLGLLMGGELTRATKLDTLALAAVRPSLARLRMRWRSSSA